MLGSKKEKITKELTKRDRQVRRWVEDPRLVRVKTLEVYTAKQIAYV